MGKGAQQTPGAGTLLAQAGPAGKVFTRDAVSKREDLCIVGNGRFSPAARRARARGPPARTHRRARARSFAEVYDAKAFRSEHPGGPMFISVFGGR